MNGLPENVDLRFLEKKELEQVCVGRFQLLLKFSGGIAISVEGRFSRKGSSVMLPNSENLPVAACSIVEMVGLSITEAKGKTDGTLILKFSNADILEIYDSNDSFESYQIEYGDQILVV